jgi:hypothetical protein
VLFWQLAKKDPGYGRGLLLLLVIPANAFARHPSESWDPACFCFRFALNKQRQQQNGSRAPG